MNIFFQNTCQNDNKTGSKNYPIHVKFLKICIWLITETVVYLPKIKDELPALSCLLQSALLSNNKFTVVLSPNLIAKN